MKEARCALSWGTNSNRKNAICSLLSCSKQMAKYLGQCFWQKVQRTLASLRLQLCTRVPQSPLLILKWGVGFVDIFLLFSFFFTSISPSFCPIISCSQYHTGKRGFIIIRYTCTTAIMITNLYISSFLLCSLSTHSDETCFGFKRKQWQLLLRLYSFNAWKMMIHILYRGKTEWLDVAYGTSSVSYRDNLIISHNGFSSQKIYNLFRKKHQVTKKVSSQLRTFFFWKKICLLLSTHICNSNTDMKINALSNGP